MMNFHECTKDYLNLKKEQYYKVAKYISETITKAGLSDCKESFEMIKKMLINNEGLSFWRNLIDAFIWQLQMLLPWIPVTVTVLSSVVIAIVSNDVSFFKTKEFWFLILVIFVGGLLVDVGIRTFSIRSENMYFRFLKEMTYEQYVFILEEFRKCENDNTYENDNTCENDDISKALTCFNERNKHTLCNKINQFYTLNKIVIMVYFMVLTALNLAYVMSTIVIPVYIKMIAFVLATIVALVVSIYRYVTGIKYFSSICYLVLEKYKIEDQYNRCYAIRECVQNYRNSEDKIDVSMNVTTLEASIAHDETFGIILPIVLSALTLFFSKADPIFLLHLALWMFVLIANLLYMLPRNAFIKKVLARIKEK